MRLDSTRTEYFMLDRSGSRFTHYPSGDTCLRHLWMAERNAEAWHSALREFFGRHPAASLVVSSDMQVVDDVNSLPCRGGGYDIGDEVVVPARSSDGHEDVRVRTIVERREVAHPQMIGPDHGFTLDDGTSLIWDAFDYGWFVCPAPPCRQEQPARARRPLCGERTPASRAEIGGPRA